MNIITVAMKYINCLLGAYNISAIISIFHSVQKDTKKEEKPCYNNINIKIHKQLCTSWILHGQI